MAPCADAGGDIFTFHIGGEDTIVQCNSQSEIICNVRRINNAVHCTALHCRLHCTADCTLLHRGCRCPCGAVQADKGGWDEGDTESIVITDPLPLVIKDPLVILKRESIVLKDPLVILTQIS